jgi:hypothetical protein
VAMADTEVTKGSKNLVVYMTARSLQQGRKVLNYAGAHGYSYTIANEGKKKLAKDVATTSGYYTGNNQRANTVVVVDDILSLTVANTPSVFAAELRAFEAVLDLYLQEDSVYKNLCFITPHKGLQEVWKIREDQIQVGHRINRQELTQADVDVLREVMVTINKFKELESRIIFDFSGSAEGGAGNKQAHKCLEIAEVISLFGEPNTIDLSIMGRKEYENPDSDFNKIVTASRWYFGGMSSEEFYGLQHGYRKYGFGKVEPDKNYYGKQTPDVTYSALYTKEPIQLLDKLYEFSKRKIDNPDGYLVAGDLNHLTSKEVARMIDTHPAIREGNNLVSPVTKGNGKPVLIELISPVLMSYRIRDELAGLDVILNSFKAKNEDNVYAYLTFYDITDMIYLKEENKKGDVKLKLQPDFNQLKSVFKLPVKHPSAVKPVPLTLSVGYDLPERNAFNSVEDPAVKVWVATDTRNTKGLRYCTLVETTDWIYVHTSAVANLRVLNLAELGQKVEKKK